MYIYNYIYLVGGWATPLKNMNVNWDDNRNPILLGKLNMATKPPTSIYIYTGYLSFIYPTSPTRWFPTYEHNVAPIGSGLTSQHVATHDKTTCICSVCYRKTTGRTQSLAIPKMIADVFHLSHSHEISISIYDIFAPSLPHIWHHEAILVPTSPSNPHSSRLRGPRFSTEGGASLSSRTATSRQFQGG